MFSKFKNGFFTTNHFFGNIRIDFKITPINIGSITHIGIFTFFWPFCKQTLTISSHLSGFVKKFFTQLFNIWHFTFEFKFISTLEKLLTKYVIISVLSEICSQNSPMMYKAALFALRSDKELIYFLIKSIETMIHSGAASSLMLSIILLMEFTKGS